MINLCNKCPRKDAANIQRSLAELFRSFGSEASAICCETKALEIESSGCEWFWGMEYTNSATKAKEVRYECGIRHVYSLIHDQGELVKEALETAQSRRNSVDRRLEELVTVVEKNTQARMMMILGLASPGSSKEGSLLSESLPGED